MLRDIQAAFGPFLGRIWINAAHQGPLPCAAAEEAYEAVDWKVCPYNLTTERFSGVPERLRQTLRKLTGAGENEIVLANSASYGLHLLANGIPLQPGDEVLLMRGDFPSDIFPWLGLEKKGVKVRFITPRHAVVEPDELLTHITSRTRVFCTTWVHSLSGWAVDLDTLGSICRDHGAYFVLNASQAVGARPLDLAGPLVDAVTCVGFKWLCGPYGTGFLWLHPELRDRLDYNQAYWLSMQTADDLGRPDATPAIRDDLGARRYDVFGTANFFNFKPWAASIEYLLSLGIDRIADHDQELVSRLIDGLDHLDYQLFSPRSGDRRSTLVFFSHRDPNRNEEIWKSLREEAVFISYRAGKLRAAPHLYNTPEEIDRLLELLGRLA